MERRPPPQEQSSFSKSEASFNSMGSKSQETCSEDMAEEQEERSAFSVVALIVGSVGESRVHGNCLDF